MTAQTISIIGLDRIGSSLGLALKAKLPCRLIGYDLDAQQAQIAQNELHAIDTAVTQPAQAIAQADILLVTVPFAQLQPLLQLAAAHLQPHALWLTFSPLKGLGLQWATQYLPNAHYLAVQAVLAEKWLADGRRHPQTASADLWQDSLFGLMPTAATHPQAIETAVRLAHLLGARPYFIDADEYDALAHSTETMPALLAAALLKTAQQANGWADLQRFAGPAFALATLPLAEPDDISQLASHQKEVTLHWLQTIISQLQQLQGLIQQDEPEILTAVLAELADQRAAWLRKRQENDWQEAPPVSFDQPSMMGHFLGGFAPGRRGKKSG